jgi:hypothetical protein
MSEIVAAILALMEQLEVKTDQSFVEAVINKLSVFGYTVKTTDEFLIAFSIQKVITHILNSCNTLTVPEGLFFVAVDRVCGEFLFSMNSSGKLELEGLDLDGAISQIKEGDTTVQFESGSSDGDKFSALVTFLKTEGAGDEVCFRKLKW